MTVAARHVHLRKPVTLKLLAAYTPEQTEAVEQRLGRARAAADLHGEHVVPIVEIGNTDDGMNFVATERLEGTTLEEELEAREQLPFPEATRWILEACEGLAEAHAAGIIHGDIRPKNLLLSDVAKKRRETGAAPGAPFPPRVLKILDFGMTSPIASMGDEGTSAFVATPAYLAPEQIREPERVGPHSDVWALGVILYELITGKRPFNADTPSGVLVAVIFDTAPLLTDAPYELARVVNQCLSKEPEKRPESIEDLATKLAPFAGEEGARSVERIKKLLAAVKDKSGMRKRPNASPAKVEPEPFFWPTRKSLRTARAEQKAAKKAKALVVPAITLPAIRAFAERKLAGQRPGATAFAAVAIGVVLMRTLLSEAPVEDAPPMEVAPRDALPIMPFVPSIEPDRSESSETAAPPPPTTRPTAPSVPKANASTKPASRSSIIRVPPWPTTNTTPTPAPAAPPPLAPPGMVASPRNVPTGPAYPPGPTTTTTRPNTPPQGSRAGRLPRGLPATRDGGPQTAARPPVTPTPAR
ncbi:serine/threonine protein kinase [Labilithrix luteola]|uniref:non-specific serine/threonine protein kinase n=1 Tax=Labilithrix luteola TaxID=1391654 RepID=A0A0K1Q9G9_9BACT|nr:serine/threonine protein kinase [Labilithrix luteola]